MNFWFLLQVFVNLVLLTMVGVLYARLNRPAKDDPRLSKGLQLLGSKLAVLGDLSDRTETQVTQLTALMDQKCREIQGKIEESDQQIQKIEKSMEKSIEVAKIFQDKIPHQEIIERQNTIKYVKAAKLAHQGYAKEDIAKAVDISLGELDFLMKVNREQLMFSEEDLPSWVKEQVKQTPNSDDFAPKNIESVFTRPMPSRSVLETPAQMAQSSMAPTAPQFAAQVVATEKAPASAPVRPAPVKMMTIPDDVQIIEREGKKPLVVKKFEFPKLDINDNLG